MHPIQIQKALISSIETALNSLSREEKHKKLPAPHKIELDIPKDRKHGDLTTNIALRLAGAFVMDGVSLAGLIKGKFLSASKKGRLARFVSRIEVSPPGFINFWFSKEYLSFILTEICKEKDAFGKSLIGKGAKVNIEFVSANPTGPLTVAHGRQAAVGDALGRILEFSGYKVCREYFINDVGVQIELLGRSIHAHYAALNGLDSEFPEDGYRGEYIKKIAEEFNRVYGKRFIDCAPGNAKFISEFGVKAILKTIESDLEKFGIFFNRWFSQGRLSATRIKSVLERLRAAGYIYEKDGATWFKSTSFGDEKDRVVIKSDGEFTYLAPDIAYHLDKYKRGFGRLIDIWGPDHHGYIPRLRASIEALGYKRDSISILIVQLAKLFRDGAALSMSTRKGEFITLREVVGEVGCDVAKFFFLMRKLDSHLDFDLGVAKKHAPDNPVYYIQYAHARIASILGFSQKLKDTLSSIKHNPELLKEPEEAGLLRMLCQFPLAVEACARSLEPYRLIEFLNELAKAFHSFYTKHRVVSDSDPALTKARLTLVGGIKTVLANGLRLLGISFPERM